MPALTLKSERQIQTAMVSTLLSYLGINDTNLGSVVDVLTRAFAQADFSLYYQIAQVSRLNDLNSLKGDDLDLKAFEYGLTRIAAQKATGTITIQRASTFEKVSTLIYGSLPSPIEGETILNVADASNSLFSTSGTLIIGRGTNNEEEIAYAVAPTDNTNYWTFTLAAPLANNHLYSESVVLKQGTDELIPAGTIVSVPATGVSEELQFELVNDATILAGELEETDVDIIAVDAGTDFNIAINTIVGTTAFPSPPFAGARANNSFKFTTGKDLETDDELRDRIKDAIPALSRAVKQAVLNAIVGLVDPETAKRVISASVIPPIEDGGTVQVYIDDGTGYEPSFESQPLEVLRQLATGGEQRFQLVNFPVLKAQVETENEAPYNFSGGDVDFSIQVNLEQETFTISPVDFRISTLASADEVVSIINDRSLLVEARTSQGGTRVVLSPRIRANESIEVLDDDANDILGFPLFKKETLVMYKNNERLYKDGQQAYVDSTINGPWDVSSDPVLDIAVDGTPQQSVTVLIGQFDDWTQATAAEMASALNSLIAGVTVSVINEETGIRITSNRGFNSDASIDLAITGTLYSVLGLPLDPVVGQDKGFTLNRSLGLIELEEPLSVNDNLTVNAENPRAKIRATLPEPYGPLSGLDLNLDFASASGGLAINFDGTFSSPQSASVVADFINSTFFNVYNSTRSGFAYTVTVGSNTYVEISSSDFSESYIRLTSGTANTFFGFSTDAKTTTESSVGSVVNTVALPTTYELFPDENLIVTLDGDDEFNIHQLPTSLSVAATSSVPTYFTSTDLTNYFSTINDEIQDYYIVGISANEDVLGSSVAQLIEVTEVDNVGGGLAHYIINGLHFIDLQFGQGDLLKVSHFANSGNNLTAIILNVDPAIDGYIEVANANAFDEVLTGDARVMMRRDITSYNKTTGQVDFDIFALNNVAPVGAICAIIPKTNEQLASFWGNANITPFTLYGDVATVNRDTDDLFLQLSSKTVGSESRVEISNNRVNTELLFPLGITETSVGVSGYEYATGLTKLVSKVLHGDDQDLTAYPGYGAEGVVFEVNAPTVRRLTVTLDVTLKENLTLSSMENQIKTAVSGYINSLGVGQDVIVERIRAAVIQITGVEDVTIEEDDNIAIADTEIARIADTDIVVG